jgi:hypothetical protein
MAPVEVPTNGGPGRRRLSKRHAGVTGRRARADSRNGALAGRHGPPRLRSTAKPPQLSERSPPTTGRSRARPLIETEPDRAGTGRRGSGRCRSRRRLRSARLRQRDEARRFRSSKRSRAGPARAAAAPVDSEAAAAFGAIGPNHGTERDAHTAQAGLGRVGGRVPPAPGPVVGGAEVAALGARGRRDGTEREVCTTEPGSEASGRRVPHAPSPAAVEAAATFEVRRPTTGRSAARDARNRARGGWVSGPTRPEPGRCRSGVRARIPGSGGGISQMLDGIARSATNTSAVRVAEFRGPRPPMCRSV